MTGVLLLALTGVLGFGALLMAMLQRSTAGRWVAWVLGVGLLVVGLLIARTLG